MKTDIYGCFDLNTLIMYALPDNKDEFRYDHIKYVYNKYQGQTILVYNELIINPFGKTPEEDLPEGLCEGKWVEAEVKKGLTLQMFNVHFVPSSFSLQEFEDIIRVTPEHKFPVLIKEKVKDVEAYLLQTGDVLLFELIQYDLYKVFPKGFGFPSWKVLDGKFELETDSVDLSGKQKLLIRSIAKIEKTEFNEPVDVYGIQFKEAQDSPYILLPNGCIIHN